MIKFGNRIEMMVDDYLIENMENLSFRKNEPLCMGKAAEYTGEWEKEGSLGVSVLDNGEQVMLYYRGFPGLHASDEDEHQTACLAVSTDGINFTPAKINNIEYNGMKDNNIVLMHSCCHNFAPFYDTNPLVKEDEKYKAIGGTLLGNGGLLTYKSHDGIHWEQMCKEPVITQGTFDSLNMAFWDQEIGMYRCYYRRFTGHRFQGRRIIVSAVSRDFIHWQDATPNIYLPEKEEDLYTNATRPVPGAEHMYLSMPMRFHPSRKKYPEYPRVGVSDCVLMTSRDGVHWNRTLNDAFISGGLYSHEWTQRCFIPLGGIVSRGDYFYFYVSQNYLWDDAGIYVYSVPKYRFLSLYADEDGGQLLTKELLFTSDDIFLNYATSAYGYVMITVLDEQGNEVFKSEEIFGNELSYKLHIEGLAGKTGRIKIALHAAHLYALGSSMMD